jgi:hypothetical protein
LRRAASCLLATHRSPEGCSQFDFNGDDELTIDELLTAVNNALNGCMS